jgi:hypothetical protein
MRDRLAGALGSMRWKSNRSHPAAPLYGAGGDEGEGVFAGVGVPLERGGK